MSRRFVSEHASAYPVQRLCELVDVKRSSYYEWVSRSLSDHYVADAWLANDIYDIHVATRRTYGAPRVEGQLRHHGRCHSRKRVARIMAECGLVGAHSRRKWRRGRAITAPAPDLLERDFTARRSDERWVADITEFHCRDGKLYLAGIKDLHDQGLAGWSMGERQTTDLVVNALVMALARRTPDGELVHHADRGSQTNTRRSSSPTGSTIGKSTRRTDLPATATTTLRWNLTGRRSNARSATSGGSGSSSRARSSARSCSNTSRSSTTVNVTKLASGTAHPRRSTLPAAQPDSQQPVSKIAGQLQT